MVSPVSPHKEQFSSAGDKAASAFDPAKFSAKMSNVNRVAYSAK
jgi:hypothetical protein